MKSLIFAVSALLFASPVLAQSAQVDSAAVRDHVTFLAGDALRGRGSATPDEAVAAAYVAARFQQYGLATPPGMTGYLQAAPVVRSTPSGRAVLTVGDVAVTQGQGLAFLNSAAAVSGPAVVAASQDPAALPAGEIVLIAPPEGPAMRALVNGAFARGARLVILRETEALKAATAQTSTTRPSIRLADAETPPARVVAVVSPEVYDRMAATAGVQATLDPGTPTVETTVTTNAVGWLPGSDPAAGVILIAAHLDHIGVRADGVVMYGANDDASGTTAVMELARALASGPPLKRGILFAAFGAEEVGGLGSAYFADNPPVPLTDIVANLAIEMIGQQDPQLPAGVMMMTGYERSTLGAGLKERGALVGPDPYPAQNFFARSDNYRFAQKGIPAHTVSGWAVTPTYHTAEDTVENLDIDFMTAAIQSLVEPLRALASGDFKPEWNEGGRPPAR